MTDSDNGTHSATSPVSADTMTLPLDVAGCHALILSQAAMLTELQAQIALRQERINLDSNNSSKPPSSDGPGWPNRAQRRASGYFGPS